MRRGVRLAIDWGDARIGVAACDRDGVLAYPLDTVPAGATELARLAERESVSLNQFITDALAGALGWRTTGRKAQVTRPVRGLHGDDEVEPQAPAAEGGRSGSLLFTVNVVVVALAAIVAIVVLLVWLTTR